MIGTAIPVPASQADICRLATDWTLDTRLAARLAAMAQVAPFRLTIISGYRSPEQQQELIDEGNPFAAPPSLSTHCACPATGADLHVDGIEMGNYEKALFGEAAIRVGLRWGGGSPLEGGIPVDWNHVDLGPRHP